MITKKTELLLSQLLSNGIHLYTKLKLKSTQECKAGQQKLLKSLGTSLMEKVV